MDFNTLFCVFLFICATKSEKRYSLKQVVILSRHGLRTPLSKALADMTPKEWPMWKEKPGYLTAKGSVLEGYMGQFFSAWLSKEELLPKSCPTEDTFYVYANTKQRTRASALAFVNKAFPDCNVTIHHSKSDVDPIFNPVIHNSSSIFKQMVIEDMRSHLKVLSLNSSYANLDSVLDYRNSKLCLHDHMCDLTTDKNKVYVVFGQKPNLSGPLKIGNSVIDAFIMEYYEGLPLSRVAWGNLRNTEEWQNLIDISRGFHNVIFNTTLIATDIAEPLIKYMSKFFLSKDSPKVVLLMGHDANMYTILNSLNFKPYTLKKQYELTPISGKIVFQKWYDSVKETDLLRIDYVYQSYSQLRDGVELSLGNPPQFELLQLLDCEIDENGFCPWEMFEKIIKKYDL